jgi:hypothetical protein
MLYAESIYLALFLAPAVFLAARDHRPVLRQIGRRYRALTAVWIVSVASLAVVLGAVGVLMPYGNWLNSSGLTPSGEFRGGRLSIVGSEVRLILTAGTLFILWFVAPTVIRALRQRRDLAASSGAASAIIVASLAVQGIAVMATSIHFRPLGFDRYFLPLLPLELALVLWGVQGTRASMTASWLVVAVFAVFAVAGTRDGLSFSAEAWTLAQQANDRGIGNERLDAGVGWDGYFRGDLAAPLRTENDSDQPWWANWYNVDIDPQYVIASREQPGYSSVVLERPYNLWLDHRSGRLLLLRRDDVPGPP